MHKILTESLNLNEDQKVSGRKCCIKELEESINPIAFSSVERPGKYTIPVKQKQHK
jgi:hypothetical protein